MNDPARANGHAVGMVTTAIAANRARSSGDTTAAARHTAMLGELIAEAAADVGWPMITGAVVAVAAGSLLVAGAVSDADPDVVLQTVGRRVAGGT